jgi:predicted NAD-dependent protein-ADP-ribosyltransferase YbiA (DUF1768 family)
MNHSSYFIKDKALFGSYPTQEAIIELEKEGVKYFIDLTNKNENKITPYKTNYKYISFPIKDRAYPENINKFSKFILDISKIIRSLNNNEKIYIHCKGGHGRSGVVVAILLCKLFNFTPLEALEHTTKYHNNRLIMRDKWRKIGSPQTYQQKNFVHNFCRPLYFYKAGKNCCTTGFSNYSLHTINIPNRGIFPNAEAALQSYKSEDHEYIQKQINSTSPNISKIIGNKVKPNDLWISEIPDILYTILHYKCEQHPELINNLIDSGIRPIIYHSKTDDILGDGYENGHNLLGKTLVKLREYYIEKLY